MSSPSCANESTIASRLESRQWMSPVAATRSRPSPPDTRPSPLPEAIVASLPACPNVYRLSRLGTEREDMAEGLGKNEVAAELTDSLKRSIAALERQEIPYVLGGGLGCWARGGPPSSNDIDLMLKPEDAERAQEALAEAGMRPETPPEQWLRKAWDGDILIDLIYEPSGMTVDDEVIARGETMSVEAMEIRVMDLDDILTTKLLALDEHSADYRDLILITRSLREQIDWEQLRERTAASPFAPA